LKLWFVPDPVAGSIGNSKALVEDPIIADRIVLAPWSADLYVMPLAGRIQLLWLLTQQLAT
jgi:hypothetical protein